MSQLRRRSKASGCRMICSCPLLRGLRSSNLTRLLIEHFDLVFGERGPGHVADELLPADHIALSNPDLGVHLEGGLAPFLVLRHRGTPEGACAAPSHQAS